MSRLMRDVSCETYVVNPDTLSSTMTRLLETLTGKMSASTGVSVSPVGVAPGPRLPSFCGAFVLFWITFAGERGTLRSPGARAFCRW